MIGNFLVEIGKKTRTSLTYKMSIGSVFIADTLSASNTNGGCAHSFLEETSLKISAKIKVVNIFYKLFFLSLIDLIPYVFDK